jgi:hypothetical protein
MRAERILAGVRGCTEEYGGNNEQGKRGEGM